MSATRRSECRPVALTTREFCCSPWGQGAVPNLQQGEPCWKQAREIQLAAGFTARISSVANIVSASQVRLLVVFYSNSVSRNSGFKLALFQVLSTCSYFRSCQVSCKPGWNLAGENPTGKPSLWVMKLGKRSLARNFVTAKAVMNQANELPEVILG